MGRSAVGTDPGTTGGGVAREDRDAWAASGLQALTGRADGPGLAPPPGLVGGVRDLAAAIARDSAALGRPVVVDPLAVMAERARYGRMVRGGRVSVGGASRLVRVADGWMAVSMARPSDWELAAAWLGLDTPVDDGDWGRVEAAMGRFGADELVVRSDGLGLPVARVGERRGPDGGPVRPGVSVEPLGAGGPPAALSDLVVADLSALWAGPLVGALLVDGGARVVKVESATRPDGGRQGRPEHFGSLNDGKESARFDWRTPAGRVELDRIVAGSDVVVTSARPRALDQLGLDPGSVVRECRPRVWLSITGYGSDAGSRDRVAFGDDAAAAGGLVVWDERGPCFCADAVADPVTGLAAAAAVMAALTRGGDHLVHASMADVAAGLAAADDTVGIR
ncbi:MAG: CoA transferase [Acidimicrobiales bacterium]|jgi:crotonobetainyl-CoA:carnitine CoA-transferase CaiB-like acyl-CoA transferase